jgi:hypothetical protein
MTKFSLVQKSSNRTQTTFHVMADGAIVGSISVPPGQVDDLLKHWHGPQAAAAKPAAKAEASRKAISASLRRGPKLSKAALLRS